MTAAKLARSQDYAVKHGLRPFAHVLVPRTKGLVATIQGLRGHLDAVYDVTIGYEGGLPSLWQYTCGWARRIHLDLRRVPIAEMPSSPEALSQWLFAAFERKDDLLETLFRTGAFPGESRFALAGADYPRAPFSDLVPST